MHNRTLPTILTDRGHRFYRLAGAALHLAELVAAFATGYYLGRP